MVKTTKRRQKPPKVTVDPNRRVRPSAVRAMHRRLEGLPPPISPLEHIFRLSIHILHAFLGQKWFDYYLAKSGLAFESYLGGDIETFMLRVYTLAELLLNLQHHAGFSECISLVAGGNLEAAFAELEVAKVLTFANVLFSFNKRTGKAKSDYDLNVVFRNGERGCAETKCKIEGRTISAQSVLHTLRQARKQLPDDRPGAIFLRMPEQWWKTVESQDDITPSVIRFMRDTRTIVAVEIFATGFNDVSSFFSRSAAPVITGTEVLSKHHKFDTTRDLSLIGPIDLTQILPPPWWKSIPALIDPTLDPRSFRL
jgi:hypothetical protein